MSDERSWLWLRSKTVDGHPRQQWERAGVRSFWSLTAWGWAGADDPATVRRWTSLNIRAKEARGWMRRGIAPDLASQWRQVASSIAEVDSWHHAGVHDPEVAEHWRRILPTLRALRRWHAVTRDPALAERLLAGGWERPSRVLRALRRLSKDDEEGAAVKRKSFLELLANSGPSGFTEFRKQMARLSPSALRLLARTHMPHAELAGWVALGAEDLESIAAWAATWDVEQASRWVRATGTDLQTAHTWASLPGATLPLVGELVSAGVSATSAVRALTHPAVGDLQHMSPLIERLLTAGCDSAPTALVWLQFHDPEDAVQWLEAGFHEPELSRALAEQGWQIADAAEWRELGAQTPQDFETARMVWTADAQKASIWVEALGAHLAGATAWRRACGDLDVATGLQQMELTDPQQLKKELTNSTATTLASLLEGHRTLLQHHSDLTLAQRRDWLTHHTADDALAWITAGLHKPGQAAAWHRAGFTPTDTQAWTSHGITDPETARTWRDGDWAPTDAAVWLQIGARDPAHAADLRAVWSEPAESTVWRKTLGANLAGATAWRRVCTDLEIATGLQQIGLTDPKQLKKELAESTATDMASLLDAHRTLLEQHSDLTLAQRRDWLTHHTADDTLAWITAGLHKPGQATAWHRAGFTPTDTQAWTSHGITDPGTARAWRDADWPPADAGTWLQLGARDPAHAAKLHRLWPEPTVARAWVEALVTDLAGATAWRRLCADLATATGLQQIGLTDPEQLTKELADSTATDPASLLDAHRTLLEQHSDLTLIQRRDWLTHHTADDALAWITAGLNKPGQATAWHRAGFTPTDTQAWTAHHVTDPNAAKAWRSRDVPPSLAADLTDVGVNAPADIRPWTDRPFVETCRWVAAGVRDSAIADGIVRLGGSLEECARIHSAAGPTGVTEWSRTLAARRLGMSLTKDVLTLDMTADEHSDPIGSALVAAERLERAGEKKLLVSYGHPHLSLRAIRAVPDARYLRGAAKARLLPKLDDDPTLDGRPVEVREETMLVTLRSGAPIRPLVSVAADP